MNEVMNAILTRRSVRNFIDETIPESILADIVDAGLHAPSGMGKKTWKFTVITNKEVIAQLAEAIATQIGSEDYDMYHPAALIIPSNLRKSVWGKEDNACALENIFLAAHSYGVGSVWLNQLQEICDTELIRPLLSRIGIPENHVVYGMAALGYADTSQPKAEYQSGGEVQWVK
ncbi:MAG: nitroreductase [Lachnospiraceae bacterium]|nr:nitroreductase [Lachnospiraceae bacterium]